MAASVALAYTVLVSFAPILDRLVLFPNRQPLDAGGAERKTIAFGNGEVEAWRAVSSKAQKPGRAEIFILRFYGNADRAERWATYEAEMYPEFALEIWGVNYPGFGGSTGPSRLATIGPAALAAFDEMKREAGDRPIFVSGSSFGTIAALHVAAERKMSGVILHNPPALREMVRAQSWWNLGLLALPLSHKIPPALDSVANARRTQAPAIFLCAEKDEVVAPRFQELVVSSYAGEKRVIALPGALHNSPFDDVALEKLRAHFGWLTHRALSENFR